MKRTLFILVLLAFSRPVFSQEEETPEILDFNRREAENFRLEVMPHLGSYVGDKLNHSLLVGADLQWNLIPALGVAANFGYSKASVDRTSALGATFTNDNLFILSGGVVATKPAAYQGKKGGVEADLYSMLGGGIVRVNGSSRGMGYFGGGLQTRFKKVPWFALRGEVKNFLLSIPNPGGSDFAYDISLTVGVTFLLFPTE